MALHRIFPMDNEGQFWLSTDDNRANLAQLAQTDWSPEQAWTWSADQRSVAVSLEAGQRYAVEGLHQTSWSTDYYAMAWQLEDGPIEVIPESALCREAPVLLLGATSRFDTPPKLNDATVATSFPQALYLQIMDVIEADEALHTDATALVNSFAFKMLRGEAVDADFIAEVTDVYDRTYAAADPQLQASLAQLWQQYALEQHEDVAASEVWRGVNATSAPTAVGLGQLDTSSNWLWFVLLLGMGLTVVSRLVIFGRNSNAEK